MKTRLTVIVMLNVLFLTVKVFATEADELRASIQKILPKHWQIKSIGEYPVFRQENTGSKDKAATGIFIIAEMKEYVRKNMSQQCRAGDFLYEEPQDIADYHSYSYLHGIVIVAKDFNLEKRETINWPKEILELDYRVVYLGENDKCRVFSKGYFWIDEKVQEVLNLKNGDDFLERLLGDLDVKDKGNMTANSAIAKISNMEETAIPRLLKALQESDDDKRTRVLKILGNMKNRPAKNILRDTYYNGQEEVCLFAGYVLTWHPAKEAEDVYIDMIEKNSLDKYKILYAIRALGQIKSLKGKAALENIIANTRQWPSFYEAYDALRKINNENLSKEVIEALDISFKAKYSENLADLDLLKAREILLTNKDKIIPDLLNMRLRIAKGNINKEGLKFIYETIKEMGREVYPYLKIALNSDDENIRRMAKSLAEYITYEK